MAGFKWSEPDPTRQVQVSRLAGDAWCARDAFCALCGWEAQGPDWSAFVEGVEPQDMERLEEHLGLDGFDPDIQPDKWSLVFPDGHPGVACWKLRPIRMVHVVYEPDLRSVRPLPAQYAFLNPELFRLLVDTRQSPR
jgi:hypothetical protein